MSLSKFTIRKATLSDCNAIAAVEATCFPPAEAAKHEDFQKRLERYANYFLLMFDGDKLISFVDGFVTDIPDLNDKMYEDAGMHNPNGAWQMIFGVNTIPEYRRQGCAEKLLRLFVQNAKAESRRGVVLTCKEKLVHYYAKIGFVDEGISADSTHGNVVWNQMRLTF